MALPTVWQLLLPQFSLTTIIGVFLILIGIFKGFILEIFGKALSFISGKPLKSGAISLTFIFSGVIMIWVPSIISKLFSSLEGTLVVIGVIVLLIIVLILFGRSGKGEEIKGF